MINTTNKEIAAEGLVQLICGSMGGAISSYLSYPMVVIRINQIVK